MFDEVMEEGSIVEWCKNEGDAIQKGDVLALVETDKATMEIEAERAGVLVGPLAPAGEDILCNDVIAKIEVEA
jgi:pyruvate dehydrogenase E2 component (dihydrolipoamide acetyltransferase)